MDRYQAGRGPAPEYRLSRDSVREVAESTPPPRGGHHFLSTDHLSTEAAAAYVDGCLPSAGKVRADAHLALCPQCRREVTEQQDARRALRGSGPIHMPGDLRERLRRLGEGASEDVPLVTEPSSGSRWSRLLRRLRPSGR